jgi:hypothetical protein
MSQVQILPWEHMLTAIEVGDLVYFEGYRVQTLGIYIGRETEGDRTTREGSFLYKIFWYDDKSTTYERQHEILSYRKAFLRKATMETVADCLFVQNYTASDVSDEEGTNGN